jgi:hypothetical protein
MSRKISFGSSLTPNTKTTVYTVPTKNSAYWQLLFLSNHLGSNKSISAWWYNKHNNTEVVIFDAVNVDAKKTLQFGGNTNENVVLEEGDEIRLLSETGSSFTYIITLELTPKSAVQFNI